MAKLRNGYSLNPRALWVGEVPDVWEFFKGKYVFGERFEKGNEKNLELLSPTQKYGVIPQSMYDELSGMRAVKVKESTDISQFKTVHIGDFCISLRSFQGGFEYSRYEGVVSPAYHILFPKKNIVDGYYKYLFKEKSFIAEMNSYCQSLRDGKNISYEDFGKTVIPYPPIDEQQAIADYLDERCSKIDEIISEATASIEEYKELKQAVIFESVTKGLDKNVPMKDSGVEWIGDIPVSWTYFKLRYVVDDIGDIDHYMPESVMCGIPYVMTGDLKDIASEIEFDSCKQVSYEDYIRLSKKISVNKGDVIFARYASIGVICYVDIDKDFLVSYSCVTIKPKHDLIDGWFLKYYLQSSAFKEEVMRYANSNVQANVGKESMYQAKIALPSMGEQKEIVNYLDIKVGAIESLISEKQALIDDLQMYKNSLIYEVVTGKRRVSDVN